MPQYRINKTGFFMGRHYQEGDTLTLHEKQAKYALLSGQLVPTEEHAAPAPKAAKVRPAPFARSSERFSKGSVGSSFGLKR